jgi:hypothetical protein
MIVSKKYARWDLFERAQVKDNDQCRYRERKSKTPEYI